MSEKPLDPASCYWAGVGASAGGLEAIQALCQSLPDSANIIYIIAQHLSPRHKSMLTELVQRSSRLKVETVKSGVEAVANTIYITPPQKNVLVEGERIVLVSPDEENTPKPSVNKLFVSLAEEKKEYAVGIILSGTGSDGALGVKAIRASGGLTIVQQPESAKYDGMPRSAIHTDCVDLVLQPREIGAHLGKLTATLMQGNRLARSPEVKDSFGELINLIRRQCGVSFKDYKRATLQRRIERRMLTRAIGELDDYVAYARDNPDEVRSLYKDILISVTNFFRDTEPFRVLRKTIDELLENVNPREVVRIWCVGCATGEEAYSLAMLLAEAVGGPAKLEERNIQVFATDVDTEALAVARKGEYRESTLVDVPDAFVKKYFVKRKDKYQVIKPLRDIILFAGHNIIEDPPFLRINLITCRNLLIYFEQNLQKKVFNIFHYALTPNGYLFLGKSESTGQVGQLFRSIKTKEKIFQKRNTLPNPQGLYISNDRRLPTSHVSAKPGKQPERHTLPESLIRLLSDAAVQIDDSFNIEHVYGDVTPYLSIASGKPQWNLVDIINDVHKQEIRALVFKALRTGEIAQGQPRKIKIDGQLYLDRIKVYPLETEASKERTMLVCFEKLRQAKQPPARGKREVDEEKIKELEDELATAREHLQTVIEELETSNEELQSMNEELQSSNEELQSSNEELETTNEELQSANEELITINDELNNKTAALERATGQLVSIKNSLDFPLVVVDDQNQIIRANHQAGVFFRISEERGDLLKLLPPELPVEQIAELVKTVKARGEAASLQLEIGSRFYHLHITPYRQNGETVIGAVLSFIENTRAVRRTQQLIESRKKAQSANFAKSEFLANISHEIRTPLNAICGVAEIFRRNFDVPDKRERLLNVLDNSTTSLKSLLDDVLDYAKLESGQLSLEYANVAIREVIEKLIDAYSIQSADKNLSLVTKMDKNLPDKLIGDPLRIQQVLSNLLSNAVKFTEQGKIELEATGQGRKHHYELRLSVRDTGIGMSPEEISRIFEKFTQTDASISRRYGGTGLGLSIVKELVNLMEGDIQVESTKGVGTEFTLSLPLKLPGKGREEAKQKPETPFVINPRQAEDNPILVVEDNESNIFVVTSFLDELGCVYDVARNGKEALVFAKNQFYPLILLDLQMDEMNGFEFHQALKQRQANRKGRHVSNVIAVSAHVERDIVEQCKSSGMQEFIAKPLQLSKLKDVLSRYLQ